MYSLHLPSAVPPVPVPAFHLLARVSIPSPSIPITIYHWGTRKRHQYGLLDVQVQRIIVIIPYLLTLVGQGISGGGNPFGIAGVDRTFPVAQGRQLRFEQFVIENLWWAPTDLDSVHSAVSLPPARGKLGLAMKSWGDVGGSWGGRTRNVRGEREGARLSE